MVKARIIQSVGRLTRIQLNQPRLPVTGGVRLAEKSHYHSQRVTPDIINWHAED